MPTIGEIRVRPVHRELTPSEKELIDSLKTKTTELIDIVEEVKDKSPRLVSLAQTSYEEAAMWAVKAVSAT